MEAALALCRALHFAGALFLFGASAFVLSLPARPVSPGATLRPFFVAAALAALVTAVAWFVLAAAAMAGTPGYWPGFATLRLVLLYTDFGTLWIWRLVLALLLAAMAPFANFRGPALAIASALHLASLALTGHAAMEGGWPGLVHRVGDGVHLLAAGFWLGGLCALAAILRTGDAEISLPALRRFSDIATPAVALVLLSGALNAFFILPDAAALFASRYGALLLAKIALAAIMVVLALLNRIVLLPRFAKGEAVAARRMRLGVAGEIACGAAVLAVAGFLGLAQP